MNQREIDRLVAEKVMGWETQEFKNIGIIRVYADDEEFAIPDDFSPSESIEDAWQVVERLRENKIFSIGDAEDENEHKVYFVNFQYYDGFHGVNYASYHKSAPLAICLAALKTVGVEVSE